MSDEIQFAKGLIVKAPRPGAPSYVKAAISIKVDELSDWLAEQDGEWVNLDVREAKSGKWYAAVNTYKREEQPQAQAQPRRNAKAAPRAAPADDFEDDRIPF